MTLATYYVPKMCSTDVEGSRRYNLQTKGNNREEKTSTKKLKTKAYKNNRRTRKKKETTKQTEETKKKFQNPLPTLQRQEI